MPARTNQGRIFWGLMLVALGVLFLLDQAGEIDFGYLVSRWWPAIFILIGVSMLIGNDFRSTGPAVFFILFGAFFLLMRMRILDRDLWHYFWPVLIIALGLWILVRPGLPGGKKKTELISPPPAAGPVPPGTASAGPTPLVSDEIRVSAVFSGQERRVETAAFRGGTVEVVFGSADIDLRDASIAPGVEAVLSASAVLGSVTVRVPRGWRVALDGSPVLGSVEDKTASPGAEARGTLRVKGSSFLGSVEVRN